ncbi:MAG: hypothetical protein Ta2A_26350 [Treponemataceae bacterium]|nr:MAG: hypothetical protein Ta2A_26350 [Treponemataceae bacterium]
MGLSMSVKKAVTQEICVRYRRAERKDKRRIHAPTSFRAATLTAQTLSLVVARRPCRACGFCLRVVAAHAGSAWLHASLRWRAVFRAGGLWLASVRHPGFCNFSGEMVYCTN